jgi:putative membrane protein
VTAAREAEWRRLSPLSPLAALGRWAALALILVLPAAVNGQSWGWRLPLAIGALVVVLAGESVLWWTTRWRVTGAALEKHHGVLRRSSARVPLSQLQAIDVVRPASARLFGLAELRLRTGARRAAVRLRFLPADEAAELRGRLLELVRESRHEVAAPEPEPEGAPDASGPLVTTPTARLAAGLLLSFSTLALVAVLALLLRFVGVRGGAADLIAIGAALWRRFNAEYRLTVAEAPDGLRLRAGLLATTAETIRSGRVQAVRLVEPPLWRPFGWCRLQVLLAGHEQSEGGGRSQRRLRTLLAIGGRADANALLEHLLPDAPAPRLRPPRRARWKSPLRFRNLSWGRTDDCAVATSGRLTRVTYWVPLGKVQSLRRVEGPVQRRLGLATVHLDTAGRGARAALRDLEREDADAALDDLIDLSRRARRPRIAV